MLPVVAKFVVSALVIVIASELVKHSGRVGAFIAAMPLVTLMVMLWMRVDNQEPAAIAEYAVYTFWYVLPTLPMFLLTPWMLQRGHGFAVALLAGVGITVVSFALTALVARRFGVTLIG